jgi:KDO2-lipid IV(A) lauroyltransferase
VNNVSLSLLKRILPEEARVLPFSKIVRYLFEAIPVFIFYKFFACMPYKNASAVGGAIARRLGIFLPVSKIADNNLRRVFPEQSPLERRKTIVGVWDNLGRLVGEMPKLHTLPIVDDPAKRPTTPHIFVENAHLFQNFHRQQQNVLFVSVHLGNWEVLAHIAQHYNMPFIRVFRKANNPFVNSLIQRNRRGVEGGFAPKGAEGARILFKNLKNKKNLGFLIDQKMNDGVEVPFFGHPAMTASAIVDLAVRFQLPIIPAQCIREQNGSFRLIMHEALIIEAGELDDTKRVAVLMQLHALFENWIRAHPEQWLWLHRRWKNPL